MEDNLSASRDAASPVKQMRQPEDTVASAQPTPSGSTQLPCTPPGAGSFPSASFSFPWAGGESKNSALAAMSTRLYSRTRSISRPQQRRSFFAQAPEARSEPDTVLHEEQAMYGAFACKNMTRSARLQLARIATFRVVEQGSLLCLPGAPMDSVYFILDGQVEYIPSNEDGTTAAAVVLSPGASLGTFHLPPHSSSHQCDSQSVSERLRWGGCATALTDVELAVVKQKQWLQVVASEPMWDARQVCLFLEELPVFGHLSRAKLFEVARMARIRTVAAGALVYKQAMEGDHVYIIRKGFVRMLRELQADKQELEHLNAMTYTVAGLSAQASNLASPRQRPPYYMPLMAASGGLLVTPRLGEKPGSGAQTHRPRLEYVASPGSLTAPGAPNPFRDCTTIPDHEDGTGSSPSPKREVRSAVRKTFRIHCPEPGEEEVSIPASPAALQALSLPPALTPVESPRPAYVRQESGKKSQRQATVAGPQASTGSTDIPTSPRRCPAHAQPRRPPNVPPLQIPVSPSGADAVQLPLSKHDSTSFCRDAGPTPHRDSGADNHLREIRRTATKVLTRTLSRRQVAQQSPLAAIAPAITPIITPITHTDSHAADRLLETLRSRKASMMLGVMTETNDRKPSLMSEAEALSTGTSFQAIRARAASQVSVGILGSNALPPVGRFPEVLGPQSYHPFTCASPRLLHPQPTQSLFVEMALLGSGRVFGEGVHGSSNKQRPTSAVADTNVELIVLHRAEVEARVGDLVSFLWCQEPTRDHEPLTSDAAVKRHLHDAMKWEVYKKQLLKDVMAQKRAKLDLLRVAA